MMEVQKYKIYVNGTPVFLMSSEEFEKSGITATKDTHVARYLGKKKQIKQYLDLLDKYKKISAVVLFSPDLPALQADFAACYKVLEAAGGYVENTRGQLLVFYRRGSWDMPKGKIDPGETPEQAALREVMEETGLQNLELGPFVGHTWHTYEMKGERILKKTWWYKMRTTDTEVTPQTEEDIEEIRWVEAAAWLQSEPVVYDNIRDVILQAQNS